MLAERIAAQAWYHRTIPDRVGGTVIVHDPNKVLG